MLLDEYPEGISVKNKWGQTPLHTATWRNAPEEIIELLYSKYPEAAEMTDTLAGHPALRNSDNALALPPVCASKLFCGGRLL